jgi:acetyl esterase/lipase
LCDGWIDIVIETKSARVSVEEDVVFGTGGDRDLKCDIYTPPGDAGKDGNGKRSGLLLVHGGAWKLGDRKQLKGYGFLIGREGIVCVASEYRLSEEAQWPAQLHDVKTALRWMRANADRLGIDPDRIAVSGASSGGHTGLIAAGTPNDPAWEGDGGNAEAGSEVAAVVSFYAPTELVPGGSMLADFIELLMGPDATVDDYAAASPVNHIGSDYPPTMILHSNIDDIVPPDQNRNLYRKMVDEGVTVELHVYDGGQPHAFDAEPVLGRESALLIKSFLARHMPAPEATRT